jgi:S-adenosylmethionine hydrolase
MRGVMLGICPEASLVDITHEIDPQDVLGGALQLAAAFRYFPAGTVFLSVVDPGVGSRRKSLAAEAGGYRFVAPDNGLLTLVFRDTAPRIVVEVTERRYARPTISRTFEGRDRFAPAAAWLAMGIELTALGRSLTSWQMLNVPTPTVTEWEIVGHVVGVDRFGNLVTNIARLSVEGLREAGQIEVTAGGHRINHLVDTYAEAAAGSACALVGSSDHLEIAVVDGSAAARLGVGRGASVTVTRR